MFAFEHKSTDLHHSVTEIIKYVERLLLFACLVSSITLCETLFKFQASCFDELSFFSRSWSAVFSQVWRRSIFKFCVYKLAEAVTFLKFKWEFVIIRRGCLVFVGGCCLLKPCKHYVPVDIKIPCVNPTSWPGADSQWIIILKTIELVTLSLSQFHAQRTGAPNEDMVQNHLT